jgi:aminoglycoside phosphotransferase (APT) family kinase protein
MAPRVGLDVKRRNDTIVPPTDGIRALKGIEPPRPPWHNRFPQTADEVARVVASDIPALAGCRAVPLGEGWDYCAFLVDDTWVFRFPKRRQAGRALLREAQTLERLRAVASLPVAVPEYRFVVESSGSFPTAYAGYACLAGEPIHALRTLDLDTAALARALGAFLGTVHRATPIPRPRGVCDDFVGTLSEFRRVLNEAAAGLPPRFVAAARRLLDAAPPRWNGEAVFVHGDLGAEHILVDGQGRLAAVIDWGDAGWGDPLGDFVGLWAWAGDAATRLALDAAAQPMSEETWRRLRTWGTCYAIGTFHYGYKAGREAYARAGLEWLTRLHRAGQLDDPGASDA